VSDGSFSKDSMMDGCDEHVMNYSSSIMSIAVEEEEIWNMERKTLRIEKFR